MTETPRPSESCRCGAPGPLVGLGQVPVWLCLTCFDKEMQAVGETTRALWNACPYCGRHDHTGREHMQFVMALSLPGYEQPAERPGAGSMTSLGQVTRTCRIESPPFGVGTPGTYGSHHERLLCTLLAGHPGDAHLCDEGWALSSWRGGEWSLLRRPKNQTGQSS